MLLLAFHGPVGSFAFHAQHTAGSHVDHSRQACLDSAAFDFTLPATLFSLAFVPHGTRQPLHSRLIAHSTTPTEFRLYNRPPPLA